MVDSRGQYLEGTTDITRTFHYDLPTEDMVTRTRYTEVLAGAIDLASLVLQDNNDKLTSRDTIRKLIGDSGSSRL